MVTPPPSLHSSLRLSSPFTFSSLGDQGILATRIYHSANLLLLGLFPLALIGEPNIQFPIDCILGTVIPLHAHVGMNSVISDYVPKMLRSKNAMKDTVFF
jgi:hypothetical protein